MKIGKDLAFGKINNREYYGDDQIEERERDLHSPGGKKDVQTEVETDSYRSQAKEGDNICTLEFHRVLALLHESLCVMLLPLKS